MLPCEDTIYQFGIKLFFSTCAEDMEQVLSEKWSNYALRWQKVATDMTWDKSAEVLFFPICDLHYIYFFPLNI